MYIFSLAIFSRLVYNVHGNIGATLPPIKNQRQAIILNGGQVMKERNIVGLTEKEVEEIVFQMILKQIEIIKDRKQINNIDVQTTQKIELQNQIRLHHEKKKILYEQYIEKKLTEEQFTKLNLELTKELEPIQNKLEEIDFQLQHSQNRNALQNQIEKITENTTFLLTQELVELFIDKIYIFQESCIEVEWKIKDFMKK